jgi:hypothetical protein
MRKRHEVPGLFLLLLLLVSVTGCERQPAPVSPDTLSDPTPIVNSDFTGTWCTNRIEMIAPKYMGYEFRADGTVLGLVSDDQNLLQHDPTRSSGQYSITSPGVCTISFPSQTGTGTESWHYWVLQNDSVLAFSKFPYPPDGLYDYSFGGTFYTRKAIGKPVW